MSGEDEVGVEEAADPSSRSSVNVEDEGGVAGGDKDEPRE